MEWYKATGSAPYPTAPSGYGFAFPVVLDRHRVRVQYIGRYQHEIAPGVLYTDEQDFVLFTKCPVGFIFGDGFESGTTSAWSTTNP